MFLHSVSNFSLEDRIQNFQSITLTVDAEMITITWFERHSWFWLFCEDRDYSLHPVQLRPTVTDGAPTQTCLAYLKATPELSKLVSAPVSNSTILPLEGCSTFIFPWLDRAENELSRCQWTLTLYTQWYHLLKEMTVLGIEHGPPDPKSSQLTTRPQRPHRICQSSCRHYSTVGRFG